MLITAYNFVDYYFYTDEEGGKPVRTIGEVNNYPSLTVPGMTMGLKEMLERYVRGGDVETFNGSYTDADIPDNLERMTEMDKIDLARDLKEKLEPYRQVKPKSKPKPEPKPEPEPAPSDEPEIEFP